MSSESAVLVDRWFWEFDFEEFFVRLSEGYFKEMFFMKRNIVFKFFVRNLRVLG